MDSWCGKLLSSIVILPLTSGNYRRRRNGSWYYDCSISFRVLFLCFFALIIVFSATKTIHEGADTRLGVVLISLSALMAGAIAVCIVFMCLVQKGGLAYVVRARSTNTSKLQVFFLWIFGLGASLFSALFLGKLIECSLHYVEGLYWYTIICFNALLVIMFLVETIFVTYFSTFRLKHCTSVKWSMFLLLTANVCIQLFVSIIGNTFDTFIDIHPEMNASSCLQRNSTMKTLMDNSRSILTPMFTEFILLSSTVIVEIWSPSVSSGRSKETNLSDMDTPESSERSPLLSNVLTTEPLYYGNRRNFSQMMTVAVSLITGFGFVMVYAAMAMHSEKTSTLRYIADWYELILKVLMLIANFVGFFCLVNYCSPDIPMNSLRGREYVYLSSVFGLFMIHICKVIQGDNNNSKPLIYTNILSIFQDYLQVVFLLHANRCKKSDPHSRLSLLESVLIFTTINNFVLWVNDTFLLSQYPITQILTEGEFSKGVLKLGGTVLLPVSVFYRFTSFLEYFATFRRYTS